MKFCPVCMCKKNIIISKLCSNMKIMGPSFSDDELKIVSCENCGLVYSYSSASQKDYDCYYKSSFSKAVDYNMMFGEKETNDYCEHIYNIISDYLHEETSVLDIGGGFGELALYFKNNSTANVTVLEMKKSCIDNCKSNGINILEGSTSDLNDLITQKYDIIIMNHILEHISDAGMVMKTIKKILKPNGILFIEVPDCSEYSSNAENNTPYAYLNFEHIIHFNENDIMNIGRLFGYSINKMGKYYKKISGYPAVWAILKNDDKTDGKIVKGTGRNDTTVYINKCIELIENYTHELKNNQKQLILWGIGASTAPIIKDFEGCNVIQLIDANPTRQGIEYRINNKLLKIMSPMELMNDSATIFVMSGPYKESICRQIKSMEIKNPVLTF